MTDRRPTAPPGSALSWSDLPRSDLPRSGTARSPLAPRVAALLFASLLAACGGGGDDSPSLAQAQAPAPAPVAATPPDALRGKSLYNEIAGQPAACKTCHLDSPAANVSNIQLGRRNPAVIASAIATNKGGMGLLDGALTDQDLADLAEYIYACRTPTGCSAL
jgi:cytochrome c553